MNYRLFLGTFLMIFLAELGDKTQLSVIGRVTDPATKWTVFAAASLALVFSTLIASQVGGLLARHLDPRIIKIGAGILFLAIGSLMLIEGLRFGRTPVAAAAPGVIGRLVLAQAARFEQAAARDYRALAARASHPEVRDILIKLANAEAGHYDTVAGLQTDKNATFAPDATLERLPSEAALLHDVAASDEPFLEHAIAHETSTAAFYTEIAKVTTAPALKQAFAALAAAELRHVAELKALQLRIKTLT